MAEVHEWIAALCPKLDAALHGATILGVVDGLNAIEFVVDREHMNLITLYPEDGSVSIGFVANPVSYAEASRLG